MNIVRKGLFAVVAAVLLSPAICRSQDIGSDFQYRLEMFPKQTRPGRIMGRRSFLITTLIICALFVCVPSVHGTLVIVGITAEATSITDDTGLLDNSINVGDIITGVYVYDSSTADSDPIWPGALYEHDAPPYGITLTVGGLVFMTDPENVQFTVDVRDDACYVWGCQDSYALESENNLPLASGVPVNSISLELRDTSCSALSSDALPVTAPVLGDWETAVMRITGGRPRNYDEFFDIRGKITSAVLIPEPATMCLLALGGLGLLRRRKV